MPKQIFDNNECPPIFTIVMTILYHCIIIMLFLWFPVFLICLPLYLLGLSIWGLPPIVSPWSRFVKYFVAVFTAGSSDDSIPFSNRVFVFLMVFNALLKVPLNGILMSYCSPNTIKSLLKIQYFLLVGCGQDPHNFLII